MEICRICTENTKNLTDLGSPVEENSAFTFLYYFNLCTKLEATLYDPLPKKACPACLLDLNIIIQFIKRAEASDRKLREVLQGKTENEHQVTSAGEGINIANVPIKLEIEENDYNITEAPPMDFTSTEFKAPQELFKCEYCTVTFTIDDLNQHMETCQREDIQESYSAAKDATRKDFTMTVAFTEQSQDTQGSENALPVKQTPKTATERSREFRARRKALKNAMKEREKRNIETAEQKQLSGQNVTKKVAKPPPKSGAQRSREFRERKKMLQELKKKRLSSKEGTANQGSPQQHVVGNKVHVPEKSEHSRKPPGPGDPPQTTKDDTNKRSSSLTQSNCGCKNRKQFKCKLCGKRFCFKARFTNHLELHVKYGTKITYKCEKCAKAFGQISDLKRHMVVHLKQRHFKCKTCGKDFTDKKLYYGHLRTHRNIIYQCPHCGKKYKARKYLLKHIDGHRGKKSDTQNQVKSEKDKTEENLGEKQFKCKQCEKAYKRKHDLTKHSKKKHSSAPISSTESLKQRCEEYQKGQLQLYS